MSQAAAALEALHRWLLVREGFTPLPQAFTPAPAMEGLFDACVARWEGPDLRVIALIADHGGDSQDAAFRAESFRQALVQVEEHCGGRLLAGVWVLASRPERAAELRESLLHFEDGHFLAKTLMGRGVLCLADGEAAWSGRVEAVPAAGALSAAIKDPSADPGPDSAEAALRRQGEDERNARRLLKPGPSPVTWALISLNILAFSWQVAWFQALDGQAVRSLEEGFNELLRLTFLPGPAGMEVMLRMGANLRDLTLGQQQLWRVLSAAFLHANALHLGMNMAALFSLGSLVERLVGPWRMAGLYLLAAVGSGLLSALALPVGVPSVGASGAILGLAGLMLAPRFKRDPRFPLGLSQRLFQWLARPLGFLFLLGFGFQVLGLPLQFDNAAHLGGLLSGFTLGYLWPSFLVRPTRRKV